MSWIVRAGVKAREGDTVRIKSGGGPVMSVGVCMGDGYWCSWWDEERKAFRNEMMYLSQLYVVEEKS
jgi:uncharacterized protein YodC (DUF2158 family)